MAVQTPTAAQKRFAQALHLGKSQAKAYAVSHPNSTVTGKALASTARRAKQSKAVQDELARLMAEPMIRPLLLEPFPEYQDARRIREHAVGLMVKLTSHSDPVVAMHAAIWLFDYSTVLIEEKKAPKKTESRADILAELRATYARSLNPPLIVEARPAAEASAAAAADSAETPAAAAVQDFEEVPWDDSPESPQENSTESIPDSSDSA
jgi:hypothetical protein